MDRLADPAALTPHARLTPATPRAERRTLRVSGIVQGVGFRPFVCRTARALGLAGQIRNESDHVHIEAEGPILQLDELERRIRTESPEPARPWHIESTPGAPRGDDRFAIAASVEEATGASALVPDQATCLTCREETLAAHGRRSHYAFTSCTQCGPRYTIASTLPFDRATTSMDRFRLCDRCQSEYQDPDDRRFHAQTNACPDCGPRLEWHGAMAGGRRRDPVEAATAAIRAGAVVALQGIGGFQLLADAHDNAAVSRARTIKGRDAKPMAVMYPSLAAVARDCHVSMAETALLESAAAPITLLRPRAECRLAPSVRRDVSTVGAFLPYSPMHWLLLDALRRPVVVTSANRQGEPIMTDPTEATRALSDVVDGLLTHDRPILHPCDDSVARVIGGEPILLRRARGYTPAPVRVRGPSRPVLALGGHLKTTVAVAVGHEVTVSPHIGDLDSVPVRHAYRQAIERLLTLCAVEPDVIACDLHPDYFTTRLASTFGKPVVPIQHHEAHVAACAAEHGLSGRYLGVAWDGSGYGRDGTTWGSEFFIVDRRHFRRAGHLRPFRLPGAEAAARDGRRCACGLVEQTGGQLPALALGLSDRERSVFQQQVRQGIHAPWTTSMGRLFDAVAALTGVARRGAYEGHAAVLMEEASGHDTLLSTRRYPIAVDETEKLELDWRPLIAAIIDDVAAGVSPDVIGAQFHAALADWIVSIARRVGLPDVVLSGGVFQNALLTEWAIDRLERDGFRPRVHRQVPPNDGGLALGQAVIAAGQD